MAKRPAASPTAATDAGAPPKSRARRGSKRVVESDAEEAGADQETPLPAKDSAAKKKKKTDASAAVPDAASAAVPDATAGAELTTENLQKLAVAQALKVLHDTSPENADEAFKQMSAGTRQALWKRF